MSALTYVVPAAAVSLFVLLFLLWHRRFRIASAYPKAKTGTAATWSLLIAYLVVTNILIQVHRDTTTLLEEGLSDQNIAQVIVTLLVMAWACILLLTRRVPTNALLRGPMFWVSTSIVVFAASTAWSLWPMLTFYRTTELWAIAVLSLHLFRRENMFGALEKYAISALIPVGVAAVMLSVSDSSGSLFGLFGSNVAAPVAGVVLLLGLDRINSRTRKGLDIAFLVVVAIAFLLFGSLASLIGLVIALLAFTLSGAQVLRRTIVMLMITGFASSAFFWASSRMDATDQLDVVAQVIRKRPAQILNLTGRLPLWSALLEATAGQPHGFGFVAGERLASFQIIDSHLTGWRAFHAHNGFLSAWIGAGWFGVFAACAIFLGLLLSAALVPLRKGTYLSLVVFLCINNLTFPIVGSTVNALWPIVVGLCLAGAKREPKFMVGDGRAPVFITCPPALPCTVAAGRSFERLPEWKLRSSSVPPASRYVRQRDLP